jgi:hypothetical protein
MTRRRPTPLPTVGALDPETLTLIPPDFQLVGSSDNWRANWSTIVCGKFSDSPFSCLFCYERGSGVAAFYQTDGAGGVQLLQEFTDWRTSWTHIIPGVFGDSGYDGLLLYDQQAGFGAIYDTDGQGNLILLHEDPTWRKTWSHIVVAPFNDSAHSAVLFYDQSAGFGAIYATDGHGHLKLLAEHSDWRTTWTAILAGQMAASTEAEANGALVADLFFYEGSTGYGETYATDGKGGIMMVGQQGGFPLNSNVFAGNFGCIGNGQECTNLLFFNPTINAGTIYAFGFTEDMQPNVLWKPVETIRPSPAEPIRVSMPRTEARSVVRYPIVPIRPWTVIATGNFWMVDPNDEYFGSNGKYDQYRLFYNGGFTDLLFYDRQTGSIQFYLKEPAETTPQEPLCGYASRRSALPGETIQFHISSQVGNYRIDIYRQGVQRISMANVAVTGPARPYPIRRTAYRDGADWPAAASFTIPAQWPSGLYIAQVSLATGPSPGLGFTDLSLTAPERSQASASAAPSSVGSAAAARVSPTSEVTYDIAFVVRPTSPGTRARILLAAADTTYEAYNYWGGRCIYGYGCSGLTNAGDPTINFFWENPYSGSPRSGGFLRALSVSFLRPFASAVTKTFGIPIAKMQTFEVPLIQWLERNGFNVDVCAASDLDQHGDLLSNYRMFVSVGHDEYWSEAMRNAVEDFVENGGNAAFLSGNTCWWAIRLLLDGNTMICCKDKTLDPDTVLWGDLGRSARSMVGTDGYTVWNSVPPQQPDAGQSPSFVVQDESHWAFEGTGLSNDDTFGVYLRPDGTFVCIVGGETNNDGKTGVLATATYVDYSNNNREYVGTMVSFRKGAGTVFNAATINWVTGLSQQEGLWNTCDQITWNVFNRLAVGWIHKDLTRATDAADAAGDPAGYTWDVDSTQHVIYRDHDSHIHELWFSYESGWSRNDLTQATDAANAAGDSVGYTWDVDSTQHVIYRDHDSHIHELWFSMESGWSHNNLTQATDAPGAAGDPAGYTWDVDSTQHVVYRGKDSHIHELWFSMESGWSHNNLTQAMDAPSAAGDPAGYAWDLDSTEHVVYRGTDNHIHELWFSFT